MTALVLTPSGSCRLIAARASEVGGIRCVCVLHVSNYYDYYYYDYCSYYYDYYVLHYY